MEWLGIWIFLSTWLVCDTWLFIKGYNSMFHKAKTDREKEIQRLLVENMKGK